MTTPPARARPASRSDRLWLLPAIPLVLFLCVPIGVLVFRASPSAFATQLGERETLQAIALSLGTTLAALAITLVLGLPLALWLARSRSRLRGIVGLIIDLPMLIPPAVAGLALLLAFGRRGPFGPLLASMGIELAFTPAAVVLAQVFVSAPFFIRSARAGLESVDVELIQAATVDGVSAWGRAMRVLIPLASPSIAAGATMAWARSLGEFGATIIFAGSMPGRTQTMPLAVYLGFETSLDRAIVLSVVMISLAIASLVLARVLAGLTPK
ncbi:MAG: ABC transporter permease [Phycisphaerales bacterium]